MPVIHGITLTLDRTTEPDVSDDQYVATRDGKQIGVIQISGGFLFPVVETEDHRFLFGGESRTLTDAVVALERLVEHVRA
jgi:hypothetical protein